MKKILTTFVAVFAIAQFSYSRSQIITTGNNLVNTSNPVAADIVIGSSANSGVRHDASMMWWSNSTASHISNVSDVFYLSVWNTTTPNIALSVAVGGPSYFNGNVGIGTTSLLSKLQVGAGTTNTGSQITMLSGAASGAAVNALSLVNSAPPATGNEVNLTFHTAGNYSPTGMISTIAEAVQPTTDMTFSTYSSVYGLVERIRIMANGSVGITTASPDAAIKLSVNGSVRAKEVKVEANWSDYVFDKDHLLRPIAEVEAYIKKNHHIPDMPSAAEVAKNGINLGETNSLLLKKIEELTLYLIDKEKQVNDQNKVIQSLEQQINQLAKKIKD
jgi:hypothetical protein